jgi:hypothetical protein
MPHRMGIGTDCLRTSYERAGWGKSGQTWTEVLGSSNPSQIIIDLTLFLIDTINTKAIFFVSPQRVNKNLLALRENRPRR